MHSSVCLLQRESAMGLLLLIVVLFFVFGGGGYYGHRAGWYGRGGARTGGGMGLGMFLLIVLVLCLLFGAGGPYMGYWHY